MRCLSKISNGVNKVYFAMGLHFHQPVGNFEKILERAYENCYKPFLDVFCKYPDIKLSVHFSGNLLDYFDERYPEFLERVKRLVECGRVEIMGGGYYEPIFQAIPRADRIAQIQMLSDYSERRFGIRPIGIWIPERVWTPEFIPDLCNCGMRYTILDDIHIIKAGISQDDLYGYFTAGYGNNKIAVFPTPKILRYIIPFRSIHKVIDNFKRVARKKNGILFTYGDDGEKFGEWPFTHDWVYKRGWLDNFFKALVKSQKWLKIVTFSEYLNTHPSLKELYIPESSYEEMLEWSGGSWMKFLTKYPESDQMHKRMMYVSKRIVMLEHQVTNRPEDRKKLDQARRELYKAQTNCPYWHGVFGGIYLYHLRKAVYEHLINADRGVDEIEHESQNNWMNTKELDFYNRRAKAVIVENKTFFICIDPVRGGVIRELDYKPKSLNLVNTLSRRRESYHQKIIEKMNNKVITPLKPYEAIKTMDARIKKGIYYDINERTALVDRFIDRDLTLEDFENCNYTDIGGFSDAYYDLTIEKDKVVLAHEGRIGNKSILVTKKINISSDREICISYILKNQGEVDIDTLFGVEFNVTMPYADSGQYSSETERGNLGKLDRRGTISETSYFSIKDSKDEFGMELIFSERPAKIWYFPIMVVSQSERSYDLNYQGSCIFPVWDIKLNSGQEIRFEIKWGFVFFSCL